MLCHVDVMYGVFRWYTDSLSLAIFSKIVKYIAEFSGVFVASCDSSVSENSLVTF